VGLACGSISHMTEFTDVSGAFGYGGSVLVGERVRLRGVRDDDLPALARWEMDAGRLITLSNWVAPPSEAAARERIAKRSANEQDDLGFAIETLDDPPVLVGRIWLSAGGTRPKDRCATAGIALGREYIGRGYGTDAMRVIVGYGFRARATPRTRRACERPAQDLARPPQAPLLPLARRAARQSHPRTAAPRGITRMEKAHCLVGS
jgi:RimJ/RimL family protein N-acetyltransferase